MGLRGIRFIKQLSIGAEAACYLAEYEQHQVEVRLFHEGQDPSLVAERQRRIALASFLSHPSHQKIVSFLFEDGLWALIAEAPLANKFAALQSRLPLSWAEAAAYIASLANLLHEAHRVGFIYGDISIENLSYQGSTIQLVGSGVIASSSRSQWSLVCEPLSRASDVYSLGALFVWLLTGDPPTTNASFQDPAVDSLVKAMLSEDPSARPSAQNVERTLRRMLAEAEFATTTAREDFSSTLTSEAPATAAQGEAPTILGRYRIIEKLGEGGVGVVYLAEDQSTREKVAIKLLRSQLAQETESLKRFQKEARLQSEMVTPYIANLLEVNEDGGCQYLVMEYVVGRSVKRYLAEHRVAEERFGLQILLDAAKALAAAHAKGIIHRDIKPDNMMFVSEDPASLRIKVTDFGIAGLTSQSESLSMTSSGALLGTPFYMAPEQCSMQPVGPAADIYSAGATLFHLLTGRPPFMAEHLAALIGMHCFEPAPSAREINPKISEAASLLIARCLAKKPEERYASGAELATALEILLFGRKTRTHLQITPEVKDAERVIHLGAKFALRASPTQVWDLLTNTNRLNRALGFPSAVYRLQPTEDGEVHRIGAGKMFGIPMQWEEKNYEWVKGRRFVLLKKFPVGPIDWMASDSTFYPTMQGGTELHMKLETYPRGLLGKPLANLMLNRALSGMNKLAKRVDDFLAETTPKAAWADPFEEPYPIERRTRRTLLALAERLREKGISAAVAQGLTDFISYAPAPSLARIRPATLASQLGAHTEELLAACLYAAKEKALLLLWDVLCPACLSPASFKESLQLVQSHESCEACELKFGVDLSSSVELVFRTHPSIRIPEVQFYCSSGPNHSPHVIAQLEVRPQESALFELSLNDGLYCLRVLSSAGASHAFKVSSIGDARMEVSLQDAPGARRLLQRGTQQIAILNPSARSFRVRVEHASSSVDAITATQAATFTLFRELFPDEVTSETLPSGSPTFVKIELEQNNRQAAESFCSHLRQVCKQFSGSVVSQSSDIEALRSFVLMFMSSTQGVQATMATTQFDSQLNLRGALCKGAASISSRSLSGDALLMLDQLLQLATQNELILQRSAITGQEAHSFLQERAALIPESSPHGLVYRMPLHQQELL